MGVQINNAFAPGITIKSEISPTGTLSIINNGLQDIASYSSINVQVPDLLEARITGTLSISSYENINISVVASYAFARTSISYFNFPNAKIIGDNAFY